MLAVGVATTVDARALRHLQPDHARRGPARAASSAVSVDVQRAAWAAEAQAPVATMVPRQRVVPALPQSTAGDDVVTRNCAALGLAASGSSSDEHTGRRFESHVCRVCGVPD